MWQAREKSLRVATNRWPWWPESIRAIPAVAGPFEIYRLIIVKSLGWLCISMTNCSHVNSPTKPARSLDSQFHDLSDLLNAYVYPRLLQGRRLEPSDRQVVLPTTATRLGLSRTAEDLGLPHSSLLVDQLVTMRHYNRWRRICSLLTASVSLSMSIL